MPEHDPLYWHEQSKLFDEAADYYDKYRPGYPSELTRKIIERSGIGPGARLLEIGAGSGKATAAFAGKGFQKIRCIEPGPNLAEAGRRKFTAHPEVEFVTTRFEDWPEPDSSFDLAYSAQAFHWVPKPLGFVKCARALKPGKFLALFWNLYLQGGNPVDRALEEFYNRGGRRLHSPYSPEELERRVGEIAAEIRQNGCFAEPEIYRFQWCERADAARTVGFLATGNGFLSLGEDERREVREEVARIIGTHGGSMEWKYCCVLFMAVKN